MFKANYFAYSPSVTTPGRPLRLLVITTGYPRFPGDIFGCFIEDLHKGLAPHASITVLAPHALGLPVREDRANVHIYRPRYCPGGGSVAYGGGIPSNLRRWSARLQLPFFLLALQLAAFRLVSRADVVHAHWGISGLLAYPACWLWRRPLVVTFRGSDLHGGATLLRLSRFVARRAVAVVCVATAQVKLLAGVCRPRVIPNPVDTARFLPLLASERRALRVRLGVADDRPLLLWAGMLAPVKNLPFLLQALAPLLREGVAQLVIVGEGPERSALSSAAADLPGFRLVGAVPYHMVHEWFQCADLHLLCSRDEGRPNVIYQAMACAVPTVATAVGGVPELILDGRSGRLVSADASVFGAVVRQLLVDDTARSAMGAAARAHLADLGVDQAAVVRAHLEVYKEALEASLCVE